MTKEKNSKSGLHIRADRVKDFEYTENQRFSVPLNLGKI